MSNKTNLAAAKAFFGFLAIILIIADQFLKRVIVFSMEMFEMKPVIPGFFSIYYVVNTGSAFSFLADKTWGVYFLTIISFLIGTLLLLLMFHAVNQDMKLLSLSLCLIVAGAYGNLIDRLTLKHVIDFLRFDFGTYTFPIFNFADICAVVGTILFVIIILFGKDYFDRYWNSLKAILIKEKNA